MNFKNIKNFKTKKSLGQNFLKSEKFLNEIVFAGEISGEDTVLEIGPGKGILTEKLLQHAGKVLAVETDYALYEFLQKKFEKEILSGKLELARGDILDSGTPRQDLGEDKVIANIPYNITGAILKKFLSAQNQPEMMVLMVQHEVAKRIMGAKNGGKESLLSISVKTYGQPSLITKVPARYFSPKPKVDSAIIKISDISRKKFEENSVREEDFWKIVRAGFAHKRKKLQSNLKNIAPAEMLAELGLLDKRAEDLSPNDWFEIAKRCYN